MDIFTPLQIIVISVVFAIAAAFHAAFGIGFPFLPTAVMSLYLSMPEVVMLTVWPNLLINVFVLFTGGPVGQVIARYWLLAAASLVGSLVGAYLLFVVSQAMLQLMLAGAIFIYVYAGFRGYHLRVSPDNRWLSLAFGLTAGVVGGATNAMAPILLIYLFSVTTNKHELAQAANLCFFLGKLAQIVVIYRLPDVVTPPVSLLGLLMAVTAVAMVVGVTLRHRISADLFRRIILLILLLLGVMLAVQGGRSLL